MRPCPGPAEPPEADRLLLCLPHQLGVGAVAATRSRATIEGHFSGDTASLPDA